MVFCCFCFDRREGLDFRILKVSRGIDCSFGDCSFVYLWGDISCSGSCNLLCD